MTDGSQRAIGLVVKLPFATREEFLAKYGANLSRGGIFLRSKTVKPPGTAVTLDLRLASGERLIHASARVEFVTGRNGAGASGMGLRFLVVDPTTQQFLDRALATLPHAQSLQPPIPHGAADVEFGPGGPSSTAEAPLVKTFPTRAGTSASAGNGASHGALERPLSPAALLQARPSQPSALSAPPFEQPQEEPQRVGPTIGVDLGTTSCRASYVRGGRPLLLASPDGYTGAPSLVALDSSSKLVVGRAAKGHLLTHPRLTVSRAKRLIGRQFHSPVVQSATARSPHEIAPGESGEAAVKLADRVYPLEQITAMILRGIGEIAHSQIGQKISRAVITVPASYTANQRRSVREAGRLAGLYVERIISEPLAAAIAFGFGRDLRKRILVYDLGGGTFDASIVEVKGNVFEVISTGGDALLGGVDFDDAIVGWFIEELEKTTARRFERDAVAMQRMHEAAERAKCALSERSESRVHLPFVTMIDGRAIDLDVVLTRAKLFELTEGLVDRTVRICQEVLEAKNLTPRDVDDVILVGAQSRTPLVHLRLQEFFGKPPAQGVHPDEAVALGAGLLASSLDQPDGVRVFDALAGSIGVGLPGGAFKTILGRNTRLPAKQTHATPTSRDDQTELELAVFQGESTLALENEYLGTLRVSELPKGKRGRVAIAVRFEISDEGLLTMAAQEQRTGRELSSTFAPRDTPDALRAKLEESKPEPLPQEEPPAQENAVQVAAAEEDGTEAAEKNGGWVGWVRRLFRSE